MPPPMIDPNPSSFPEPTTAIITRATIMRDEATAGSDDEDDDAADDGADDGSLPFQDGNSWQREKEVEARLKVFHGFY